MDEEEKLRKWVNDGVECWGVQVAAQRSIQTWQHTEKCDPFNPSPILQPGAQQCTKSLVGGAVQIRLEHKWHRLKGAIELNKMVKLERKAHNL